MLLCFYKLSTCSLSCASHHCSCRRCCRAAVCPLQCTRATSTTRSLGWTRVMGAAPAAAATTPQRSVTASRSLPASTASVAPQGTTQRATLTAQACTASCCPRSPMARATSPRTQGGSPAWVLTSATLATCSPPWRPREAAMCTASGAASISRALADHVRSWRCRGSTHTRGVFWTCRQALWSIRTAGAIRATLRTSAILATG